MRRLWRVMVSRAERLALVGHAEGDPLGDPGEAHGRRGTDDPDFNVWADILVVSRGAGEKY